MISSSKESKYTLEQAFTLTYMLTTMSKYWLSLIPLCTPLIQADTTDDPVQREKGRISLYIENDILQGTDENYTNGGRLAWISGQRNSLADVAPLQRRLDKFSGGEDSSSLIQKIWGFGNNSDISYQYGVALTQLIFTPVSTAAITPLGERPYASWLGLGFSLHVSDPSAINSIEFTIGTIGPHAFGQETQEFVHELRDLELFQGWDSQVPNELTANIHFNQKRRFVILEPEDINNIPIALNAFSDMGLSVGNFKTSIDLGWQLQLGYNLPIDFSDPRLSPTANSISWTEKERSNFLSVYLIGGFQGSAVAHDATLDGPLFRDFDTGVNKEILVGELYAGIGISYKDVEFSYIETVRTREFKEQTTSQRFGSLALRVHF